MHFYTTGSVPLEIWGKSGVSIVTVWNLPPNAPTFLWGITNELWISLTDKGVEIDPTIFAGESAKFTLTVMNPQDWGIN